MKARPKRRRRTPKRAAHAPESYSSAIRRLPVPEHVDQLAGRWELIAAAIPRRLMMPAKKITIVMPDIVRMLGALNPSFDFSDFRALAASLERKIGGWK